MHRQNIAHQRYDCKAQQRLTIPGRTNKATFDPEFINTIRAMVRLRRSDKVAKQRGSSDCTVGGRDARCLRRPTAASVIGSFASILHQSRLRKGVIDT